MPSTTGSLQSIFQNHPTMSPSRDIKSLFDRFGGDPDSYREIRMESEAHEARGRWPLLGMIDPRKVELSAAETARGEALTEPAAEHATPEIYEGVRSSPAMAGAGGGTAARDRSQAVLRRSAPLFTRSPRRDIPPVIEKAVPQAPESGAFRFSPQPAAADVADEAAQPVPADAAAGMPRHEPRIAPRSTSLAPPAVNATPEPVATARGVAPAARSESVSMPLPSSPLKKLFGAALPMAQDPAPAQEADAGDRLDRLFDRLRGGGAQAASAPESGGEPKASATPRHPGFPKGVSRP
jgi:resuscitation-promoting factor RpfA